MTFSRFQKAVFSSLLLALLAGCKVESVSFWIGSEQALTLIRTKQYLWSDEFLRTLTVTSQPDCVRRYSLSPDGGKGGNLKVFKAAGGGYVLQDGIGQYRVDLASCGMLLEGTGAAPGELLGAFESSPEGGIRFAPISGTQKK